MLRSNIDIILSLIALSILADDQVHPVEIDVFTVVSQYLPTISQAARPMSDIQLRAWYINNKINLFRLKNSSEFNVWLSQSADKIQNIEDQYAILLAMDRISKSDTVFHIEEKNLISFLASYWNLDLALGKSAKNAI